MTEQRSPLPPFTPETAVQEVRKATMRGTRGIFTLYRSLTHRAAAGVIALTSTPASQTRVFSLR